LESVGLLTFISWRYGGDKRGHSVPLH
jgi:hypothetical protein